jgi:AhpD family alkylhydroperoxidase
MSAQHSSRLDYARQSPALFAKYLDFALAIGKEKSLPASLLTLVDIRASQLNGCAFCLDMHVKEATLHGERALRLHHVAIWRESPLFDDRERAALAWTEALTQIAPTGVSEALFEEVRERFSEKELADLTFRVIAINGWNRANVAFRTMPGTMDQAYGLDEAGLA